MNRSEYASEDDEPNLGTNSQPGSRGSPGPQNEPVNHNSSPSSSDNPREERGRPQKRARLWGNGDISVRNEPGGKVKIRVKIETRLTNPQTGGQRTNKALRDLSLSTRGATMPPNGTRHRAPCLQLSAHNNPRKIIAVPETEEI